MSNMYIRFLTCEPTSRRRLARSGSMLGCWGVGREVNNVLQGRLLLMVVDDTEQQHHVIWCTTCAPLLQWLQRMAFVFFFIHFFSFAVLAQVPPLQWINLSNLLQGSKGPPPLRDAAMGYDETRLVFHPSNRQLDSYTSQSLTHHIWRIIQERLSSVRDFSVGLASWHLLYILTVPVWISILSAGPFHLLRLPSSVIHPREVPLFVVAILLQASESFR